MDEWLRAIKSGENVVCKMKAKLNVSTSDSLCLPAQFESVWSWQTWLMSFRWKQIVQFVLAPIIILYPKSDRFMTKWKRLNIWCVIFLELQFRHYELTTYYAWCELEPQRLFSYNFWQSSTQFSELYWRNI